MEPWDAERTDFAIGTAIMHNVAAHGVTPKEPIEYMRFIPREEPKAEPEEKMKDTWDVICKTRGKMEEEQNG